MACGLAVLTLTCPTTAVIFENRLTAYVPTPVKATYYKHFFIDTAQQGQRLAAWRYACSAGCVYHRR